MQLQIATKLSVWCCHLANANKKGTSALCQVIFAVC